MKMLNLKTKKMEKEMFTRKIKWLMSIALLVWLLFLP